MVYKSSEKQSPAKPCTWEPAFPSLKPLCYQQKPKHQQEKIQEYVAEDDELQCQDVAGCGEQWRNSIVPSREVCLPLEAAMP